MEEESWLPGVNEPMEEYLKSDRYLKSSAKIRFSDFKGQEEENYAFWRHLTSSQRIQLHTIMISSLYRDKEPDNDPEQTFELIFTTKSI